MPENSVLTEKHNNTLKSNSPMKISLLNYNNARNEKSSLNQGEYVLFGDYSATCGWNEDELPARKMDFFTTISPKSKAALPPLASVFSNSKTVYEDTGLAKKDDEKSYDIIENQDKIFADIQSNFGDAAMQSNCISPHFYSNSFPHAMFLQNTFVPSSNERNEVLMSSTENNSLIRKRQHSSTRETTLPPNVNTAFKKLRNLIPTEPADRRLSKVETLRLAVSYIQHLGQTLNTDHWVEQPCLVDKIVTGTNGNVTSPICTFCMSKRRKICTNSR